MAETMMVQVTLVTCQAHIEAQPGDKLMLLNGVCVGVSTERGPAATTLPPGQAQLKLKDKDPANQRMAPQTRRRPVARPITPEEKAELQEQILDKVRLRPGISTTELVDALGIDRNAPGRWRVRDQLRSMQHGGRLRCKMLGSNPKMGQSYWLTEDFTE